MRAILARLLPPAPLAALPLALTLGCGGEPFNDTQCIDIDQSLDECPAPEDALDELKGETETDGCVSRIKSVDDEGARVGYIEGEETTWRCCYPVSGTREGECGAEG